MRGINRRLAGAMALILSGAMADPVALAALPGSPHYQLLSYSIGAGGGLSSSTHYRLAVMALGPTAASAIDSAGSPHYRLSLGPLHTLPDTDGDRVIDWGDNCLLIGNPDQRNTNAGTGPGQDRYGNLCDADLNDNGVTNTLDFGLFKLSFGQIGPGLDADFNGDGRVNTLDFGRFKLMFGRPPGPSGLSP